MDSGKSAYADMSVLLTILLLLLSPLFQYYCLLAFAEFVRRRGCFSAGVLRTFGGSFRWNVFR